MLDWRQIPTEAGTPDRVEREHEIENNASVAKC